MQCPTEKVQKEKQWSTKYYTENWRMSNTNSTKNVSYEVWSSCFVCVFIWIWPVFMIFRLYKHLCFAFRKLLFKSTVYYIIFVMLTFYIVMSVLWITYTMHLFEFNLQELTTNRLRGTQFYSCHSSTSPYCWRICDDD